MATRDPWQPETLPREGLRICVWNSPVAQSLLVYLGYILYYINLLCIIYLNPSGARGNDQACVSEVGGGGTLRISGGPFPP